MKNAVRTTMFFALAGVLLIGSGCASKKKTTKQIGALEAQMGVVTEELTRLDQQIQELRSGSQATSAGSSRVSSASSSAGGNYSDVYRTPSGFELPSHDIQSALKNAGYYQGNVDGKIGPATKDAVKAFQRDNGLEADGVVGRRTWDKLKPYLSGVK